MRNPGEFALLYSGFDAPISHLDCGKKCSPYNENGAPFCCDTRHAVPTVYTEEWVYLQENTDLWHVWQGSDAQETNLLESEKPHDQVLVECLGYLKCQRSFRSLTCRAFPFFPYITREGEFIGLSHYWDFEDRCWVISNLKVVSPEYLAEFFTTFDRLFNVRPEEFQAFQYHSMTMRRVFGRKHRTILLVHRNGNFYEVTPRDGRLRHINASGLPKFGPYEIAASLRFDDEE